jgi:hypothetical protein
LPAYEPAVLHARHRLDQRAVAEAVQTLKRVEHLGLPGRALRHNASGPGPAAGENPPHIGADRPAVVGLNNHEAQVIPANRFFATVGPHAADELFVDRDDELRLGHEARPRSAEGGLGEIGRDRLRKPNIVIPPMIRRRKSLFFAGSRKTAAKSWPGHE